MNMHNFVILQGRTTDDFKVSKVGENGKYTKVRGTLAVMDNYKSGADNKKATQFIPFEKLVDSEKFDAGKTVYNRIGKGDKISIQASLKNNNYKDKDGNMVYGLAVVAEEITLEESKAVTDARRAKEAAAEAAPAEEPIQ